MEFQEQSAKGKGNHAHPLAHPRIFALENEDDDDDEEDGRASSPLPAERVD